MKRSWIILLITLVPIFANAQQFGEVMTEDRLMRLVEEYHPVSVQSQLLLRKGESKVRKARGGFDPKLGGTLDQKYYDDKDYYSLLDGGLKIPTWYGVEVKTGYEQNQGQFLNDENTVPAGGLWYAGISVPLGKGLIIDKRRATLQQAQLYAQATEAERQQMLNNLYFDANKQYWKWVAAWNQIQVYEEALELARVRFGQVKRRYELGDKPAIDTLEAMIQVQNRQLLRNQSRLDYQNMTLDLSNFLWFENNTPLIISEELRPPSVLELRLDAILPLDTLQDILENLAMEHPAMQLYDYKQADLEVERRIKAENLKPEINLNYNALNEPVGLDVTNGYVSENYKWGASFNFPLFLRKQRGDLQLTKIKIQETELGQQQKLLELQNKVRSYYNEQINLDQQVTLMTVAVRNYSALLAGERQKFETGESSLFLINSREVKLIEARLKSIELVTKYQVARTGITWSSGKLYRLP